MEKKIAQMFIVAVPLINDEKELFRIIKEYIKLGVGGFMIGVGGKIEFLETNNIIDLNKVKYFVSKLKKLDPTLFLAIDGEGGSIFNFIENVSQLKCSREYGLEFENSGSTKQFEKDLKEYISIMKDCGVNMNFAPILDTAQKEYKGYITEHGRSYSDNDNTVKILSSIAIKEMQKNKIIAVGKHFPSYGFIDENPHTSLKQLKNDIKLENSPFDHAIKQGIYGIMKGHTISDTDKKIPATLSLEMEDYLRKKLNFNGLAITDELFMGALNEYYAKLSEEESFIMRAVDSAKCNDILLISYPRQKQDGTVENIQGHERFPKLHKAVCDAARQGKISENKINESYELIIKYKKLIGLCNPVNNNI